MPPKQQKRGPGPGRGRGKRLRDDEEVSSKLPQTWAFSAINSPPGSTPQLQHGQSSPVLQHSSSAPRSGHPGQHSIQAPPRKVAIPALKNHRITDSAKANKKGRNPHACDFCRKAKAGCTGGNPCTRCLDANVPCVYGDGKRDKDKKRMSKLNKESISRSRHIKDVADALRRIRLDTKLSNDEIRSAIDGVLSMTPVPLTLDEEKNIPATSRDSSDADEEGQNIGDEDVDVEVGSTGSLDVTDVNTDLDDTRATGHMGKSSSVAWAKRTAEAVQTGTQADNITGGSQSNPTLASYHTEDADVEFFDTSNINCFDWPEPKLADILVQSYFDTVHKALPLVDKIGFMSRYDRFDRASVDLEKEDFIWLGMLNTIFAISAVHAHLTRSPHRGHYWDHLIYVARAKTLCLDQGLLYEDARVSTTSALGLLCLYFISTCRLNRAWTICGLAIRHALTLGLHVRSEAGDLSDYAKENRVRLWWSLYSLECLLNELTGRPSCISDRDISTPLPININEEEFRPGQPLYDTPEDTRHNSKSSSRRSSKGSKELKRRPSATCQMPIGTVQPLTYSFPVLTLPETSSTYFIYRTQLSIMSHEIVTQLYCAATIKERWVEVQDTIKRIDGRLQAWQDKLPAEYTLDFDRWDEPDWSNPHVLPRMGLAMLFNSSRMILFRPCLCKFEGRMLSQSEKSKDFNSEGVQRCIDSARTMINLIGWTSRNVEKLYTVTAWWHTLHYLCEALSVLMLELAYQAQHLPAEAAYILDDAKKGIRWLIMMSEESISARKAWEIFDSLIRVVAPRINWSVYDLPTTAPVPLGYDWRRSGIERNKSTTQQQMPQSENLPGFSTLDPQLDPTTSAPISSTIPWPSHTYAPTIYGQELVSNPLDQERAFQMFGGIGALHGHYDEPWHHMFGSSAAGAVSNVLGGGVMEPAPLLPPSDMPMAEQGSGGVHGGNISGAGQFEDQYANFQWINGGTNRAGFL